MDNTLAEPFLQNIFDASDHEINNRLRRVNNAVRVRDFDGKAAKESLIDSVEKFLLLHEIFYRRRRRFNRFVEMIEPLEEFLAAERLRSERVTFSISRAITLRLRKSEFLKIVRKIRSVKRC